MNIIFSEEGKEIYIEAQPNDKFDDVTNKYADKAGITSIDKIKFVYDIQEIPHDSKKTIEELGICKNGIIKVILDSNYQQSINIIFNFQGKNRLIYAQNNTKFSEACIQFFEKMGFNANDKPKFFINGGEIPKDSQKTLNELGIPNMGQIEVILTSNLLAAF